jgi:hypothetical protein
VQQSSYHNTHTQGYMFHAKYVMVFENTITSPTKEGRCRDINENVCTHNNIPRIRIASYKKHTRQDTFKMSHKTETKIWEKSSCRTKVRGTMQTYASMYCPTMTADCCFIGVVATIVMIAMTDAGRSAVVGY